MGIGYGYGANALTFWWAVETNCGKISLSDGLRESVVGVGVVIL